jgi:hypothetical protein
MSRTPAPRAALAWWGATACWFLGSVLSRVLGRPTELEAAVPVPVALLAYVLVTALWATLVHGVHRGVPAAHVTLAVVGALGVVDLVLQLAGDVVASDFLHGAFFLAALVLSVVGYVLLLKRR